MVQLIEAAKEDTHSKAKEDIYDWVLITLGV
jgi:hypothetical protein